MGSQRQATQPQGNPPLRIMDINLDFLKPLYELVQNEEVQRKMEETARLYWSPDVDDNTVTVNLIPSVIALIIAALIALPLLGAPSSGYGAPSHGHGRSDIAFYEQSIADLQQQVANLQGSAYYPGSEGAQDTNGIGYSS